MRLTAGAMVALAGVANADVSPSGDQDWCDTNQFWMDTNYMCSHSGNSAKLVLGILLALAPRRAPRRRPATSRRVHELTPTFPAMQDRAAGLGRSEQRGDN